MYEDLIVNREPEFLGSQGSVLVHANSDSTPTTISALVDCLTGTKRARRKSKLTTIHDLWVTGKMLW